jgi:hypothetical protein
MIYTLTTFEKITRIEEDSNGRYTLPFPTFGDRRCVGYFDNIEDALINISESGYELRDHMYDYCIIEEYEQGLFSISSNRYLFKRDGDRYIQVDEPITINKVTNFAMG